MSFSGWDTLVLPPIKIVEINSGLETSSGLSIFSGTPFSELPSAESIDNSHEFDFFV